jgi:FlaA1/EpsC-like NDP-sugar epimerase
MSKLSLHKARPKTAADRKESSWSTQRAEDFVLGSMAAIGASGAALAADREIRTVLIGIGNRGTSLLKQALAQTNIRIAAVCDTDPNARDKAQSLAQRDSPKSFTDYRQVLELKNVDTVHIATLVLSACPDGYRLSGRRKIRLL